MDAPNRRVRRGGLAGAHGVHVVPGGAPDAQAAGGDGGHRGSARGSRVRPGRGPNGGGQDRRGPRAGRGLSRTAGGSPPRPRPRRGTPLSPPTPGPPRPPPPAPSPTPPP